jgi:hypothetical protein
MKVRILKYPSIFLATLFELCIEIFVKFGRISGYWRSLKQKRLDFRTLNFLVSLSGFFFFFFFRFLAII